MNKKDFIDTIEKLQVLSNNTDNLNNAFKEFDPAFNFVSFGRYESLVINMLKKAMKDEYDWIGYYIYELDYGKKYKKGCVIDNGKNIKLKTPSDLYDFLIK